MKFKAQLLNQNVAAQTADGILENLRADLLKCEKSTFTSAQKLIKKVLSLHIAKIICTSPGLILGQVKLAQKQR